MYSGFNISIHGIHPSMTLGSPTFGELWPTLEDRIGGRPVVAHNDRAVVWRGAPLSRYDAVIMAAPVTAEIERLVNLIVAEAHPLRVILFGSAARGDMTPGSDIDLLVVMRDGTHRLHTMQRLYGCIRGVAVPFDILVATTADLEARGEALSLIYRDALREGKELYAA